MLAPRYQTLRTFPRAAGKPRGFTLAELLITIGIIGLLIGLLIPTVTAVRRSAQDADTRQFIAAITAACEAYYQDFQSYPGPLSNDQIYARSDSSRAPSIAKATTPNISAKFGGSVTSFVSGADQGGGLNITGSENLVLGLLGGVKIFEINSTVPLSIDTWGYDGEAVGGGAASLNPTNQKKSNPYMQARSTDLYKPGLTNNGRFTEESGAFANDSSIPELLDRYPSQPMPILYLRARKGAPGIMSDNFNNAPTSLQPATGTEKFQYDRNDIAAYVDLAPSSALPIGLAGSAGHGLRALGTVSSYTVATFDGPLVAPGQNKKTYRIPYLNYFKSPTSATSTTASTVAAKNLAASPRQKDSYILISAGRDRVYGTIDDITNFGPLE